MRECTDPTCMCGAEFVCMQCGKDLTTKESQKCPYCLQWTNGLTRAEYIALEKSLKEIFGDPK